MVCGFVDAVVFVVGGGVVVQTGPGDKLDTACQLTFT